MESGLKHFLIVFDAGLGRQIRIDEFDDADDAVEAYKLRKTNTVTALTFK